MLARAPSAPPLPALLRDRDRDRGRRVKEEGRLLVLHPRELPRQERGVASANSWPLDTLLAPSPDFREKLMLGLLP